MIGMLIGEIVQINNDGSIILLVNGVGYEVNAAARSRLNIHRTYKFLIHTELRDDSLTLYGFDNDDDLYMFKTLLSIKGIGPRKALLIVSSISFNKLVQAIDDNDFKILTDVKGIGLSISKLVIAKFKVKP